MRIPRRRVLWGIAGTSLRGFLLTALPRRASAAPRARRGRYFTDAEIGIIRTVAREVLPERDVLDGTVDVARNLDDYLARFPSYDLSRIRKGLRLLNADITYALARVLGQATALDRTSVSKYVVTLGYYGDANGEADLPKEKRRLWPRIGYRGPTPRGFAGYRVPAEPLDETKLADRLEGRDPLSFLATLATPRASR